MKKTLRKITAMATALLTSACLMMPMTMSYTAFAVGTGSISITNNASGHTYEAYQIFSGNASGDTLGSVAWGSGVTDGAALLAALKNMTLKDTTKPFADCADVRAVATKLATGSDDSELIKEFAKVVGGYLNSSNAVSTNTLTGDKYVISGLEDGYYLVKETNIPEGTDTAYTSYIVEVIDGVNEDITPKVKLPEFDKQVQDVNDTDGTTAWGTSADYDIGDEVPFQLTATIPANYDDYSTYKFVMHDTLSAGLSFKNDVVVKIGETTLDSSKYSVVTTGMTDGCTFEIQFANLKDTVAKAGDTITVTYSATLNTDAVIGNSGNPNEAYLEYSNNPTGDGTGKTPVKKAVVFTYKAIINKVDSDNQSLNGATFQLEKNKNGSWQTVATIEGTSASEFIFDGLDDGKYKLTETKTPDGYNTIEPIEFEITAAHDASEITELNCTSDKFTTDADAGTLTAEIVNNKGSELPSTGGIGTTIFYVGGGALVAVAGVFLIAKKRMSSK